MTTALSTPFGLTTPEQQALAEDMMAIAARAYPPSPEGFVIGVAFGRLLAAGASFSDLRRIALGLITKLEAPTPEHGPFARALCPFGREPCTNCTCWQERGRPS